MWIKIIVLVAMAAVLVNLFIALFHLNRGGQGDSRKTLRALSWRLGISIALFVFLFVAARLGWVTPHGLPQTGPTATSAPASR
jgi:Flp pilus assembly protein protease CpaA